MFTAAINGGLLAYIMLKSDKRSKQRDDELSGSIARSEMREIERHKKYMDQFKKPEDDWQKH